MGLLGELCRLGFVLVFCVGPGLLLSWVICRRLLSGVATFALVLFGNLAIMVNAWWVQGAQPVMSFDNIIHHGSYAAIFDIVLAISLGTQAGARRHAQPHLKKWMTNRWWFFTACSGGITLGLFFHYGIGGASDSQSPDLSVRMHDSATSWAHNLGVMPAIAAMLIYYCPQLYKLWTTSGVRRYAVLPTACLLIYFTGVILDQLRIKLPASHAWHLNVHWLDVPGVEWDRFSDVVWVLVGLP